MKWTNTEDLTRDERTIVRAAITALLENDEAMRRLYGAARAHVRDTAGARELVWDVVGDVLLGELTCDLARDLGSQVEREVRRRAKRARRDATRIVFIPLEEMPADALIIDTEPDGNGSAAYRASDAIELVARIRKLAREDKAVLQLLGHYERGRVTRREIIAAGMTAWVYRAARERLDAYAVNAATIERIDDSAATAAGGIEAAEDGGATRA